MDTHAIDEQLLSAWVDGELDARPDERERVEAWLREHPQDAARVRLWAADRDALRARLAPMLDEPVPARLRALVRAGPVAAAPWRRAAIAAGLLLAGGVAGALIGRHYGPAPAGTPVLASAPAAPAAGWVQRAAYAHEVYVPEPRHAVEVRAQEEHLARWLTRRIDAPVKLFDLHEQGFELVGGRLLPDGAGKSAQLMYQDAQGLRITVYLRKPDAPTDAAFRYERQGDAGVFYWVESGAGYAVVGTLPKEQLLAIAESIHRQHPGVGAGASAPK
ncbi:MAG TPA: anti-sigma factor [Rubrivivax sp.]|nr:anti-sigma factor [Rubrivivax sp.]